MRIEIFNADFRDINIDRKVDLFIVDPPYGNIIKDRYDQLSEDELLGLLYDLLFWCECYSKIGTTLYVFGGIGKYKYRPFFRFLSEVEIRTKWVIHDMICWAKRRGYGKKYGYMFAREEIAMLVYNSHRPCYFDIPYLDQQISDGWKKRLSKAKYKTRTGFKRRTNVFYDINEVMRNQFSTLRFVAQKPEKLFDVLIKASCPNEGLVVDPMCGVGTTGIVCQKQNIDSVLIDINRETCETTRRRIWWR